MVKKNPAMALKPLHKENEFKINREIQRKTGVT